MPKRTPNKESMYLPQQYLPEGDNRRRIYAVDAIDDQLREDGLNPQVEAVSAVHAMKLVLKSKGIRPLPKIKKQRGTDLAHCFLPSETHPGGVTIVRSWQVLSLPPK